MEEETNLGSPKSTMSVQSIFMLQNLKAAPSLAVHFGDLLSSHIGYWPADHNAGWGWSSEQAHCHHFSCAPFPHHGVTAPGLWVLPSDAHLLCQQHSSLYRWPAIWLAVLLGSVGSPVTRMGSGGGRDSFLGAAGEGSSLHLPMEKWEDLQGWREPRFRDGWTLEDAEFDWIPLGFCTATGKTIYKD